ncbi:hypothetical protein Tco_1351683 [Tanacetum coccineum]
MASQEILHRETKGIKFNDAVIISSKLMNRNEIFNDISVTRTYGEDLRGDVEIENAIPWPETDEEQAQPREYLGCWRANCEDYVVVGPVVTAVGLYHIHAAGGPPKEPVGPVVELHHKKKGVVGFGLREGPCR